MYLFMTSFAGLNAKYPNLILRWKSFVLQGSCSIPKCHIRLLFVYSFVIFHRSMQMIRVMVVVGMSSRPKHFYNMIKFKLHQSFNRFFLKASLFWFHSLDLVQTANHQNKPMLSSNCLILLFNTYLKFDWHENVPLF